MLDSSAPAALIPTPPDRGLHALRAGLCAGAHEKPIERRAERHGDRAKYLATGRPRAGLKVLEIGWGDSTELRRAALGDAAGEAPELGEPFCGRHSDDARNHRLLESSMSLVDNFSRQWERCGMTTLLERIDWILANRPNPAGKSWTARSLSTAAGQSPSFIAAFKDRWKRLGEADIGREPIVALANAAGVSVRWLMEGLGEPELEERDTFDSDVFDSGVRRFREWVQDEEPQHAGLLDAFLGEFDRQASRWPAQVTRTQVEEELLREFRRWRRGNSDVGRPFPT